VTARLEHPGVVPVHGLVRDDSGQPCYAMRFVQGETLADAIRRYHDAPAADEAERRVAFRQLLQRFVTVCQTVAYAHSRGVVHRDLKPANVMLGRFGETLVIDWGLARTVGRTDIERSTGEETLRPTLEGGSGDETQMGSAVGTPAFMSPEQAAGRWDVVGPAADIYSLGATLYLLLTGRPPVQGDNVHEVRQKVQQGDYLPPRQVKPDVPRPLEAVCLQAMALKPEGRYASALDLARDVERWLADEPVAAYRDPLASRAARWVRRHRAISASAVAALAAVAAGLGVGLVLVGREQAQTELARQETERQRIVAEGQRDEANEMRQAAQQAFDEVISEEALDWLKSQPELLPQQRRFLEQARAYYERFTVKASSEEQAQAQQAAALFRVGTVLALLGQRRQAEQPLRRAIELYDRLAADNPAQPSYRASAATGRTSLGQVLTALGRRAEAEPELRAAIAERERLAAEGVDGPEPARRLARSLNELGILLIDSGRPAEAEPQFRRAAALNERCADRNPAHPRFRIELADDLNNLGRALVALGRQEEGENEYRRALELRERLAAELPTDPEPRRGLAAVRNSLGLLLATQNRLEEAGTEYRLALKYYEPLCAQYPSVRQYTVGLASVQCNLGLLARDRGDPKGALDWFDRSERSLVPLAASDATARQFLRNTCHARAEALDSLGRPADAARDWARALELDEGPRFRSLRLKLAFSLVRVGETAAAAREVETVAARPGVTGPMCFDAACAFALVSAAENDAGRKEKAAVRSVELLRRAQAAGFFTADQVEHLKKDGDLDSLRGRDDYKKLLAELEAPRPAPPR
jgi:serine/threonine-protein kinase